MEKVSTQHVAQTRYARTKSRRKLKDELYTADYAALRSLTFDTQPSLYFNDGESIMALLAEALQRYKGRLTPAWWEPFSTRFVIAQAHRFHNAVAILKNTRPFIKAAIRKAMPYGIFDNALTTNDLEQDIAARVFATADELTGLGTAKLSTRVTALTKRHLAWYYTQKMEDRFNAISRRIAGGQSPYGEIETISNIEWASIKAEEINLAA